MMHIAKARVLYTLYTVRAQLANMGIGSLMMIREYWSKQNRPPSLQTARSIQEFVVTLMEMLDPDHSNRIAGIPTKFMSLLVGGDDPNALSVLGLGTHKPTIKKAFLERFNKFSRPDKIPTFVKNLGNLCYAFFPFVSGIFPKSQQPLSFLYHIPRGTNLPFCMLCFKEEDSPNHLSICENARIIGNAFSRKGDEGNFGTFCDILSRLQPPPAFPQSFIATELGLVCETLLAIRRNSRKGWSPTNVYPSPFQLLHNHVQFSQRKLQQHITAQVQWSWNRIGNILSRIPTGFDLTISFNPSNDNNCLFTAITNLLGFPPTCASTLRATAAEFTWLHPISTKLSPHLFHQGRRKTQTTNSQFHASSMMKREDNNSKYCTADARAISSIGAIFGLYFSCIYFDNDGGFPICTIVPSDCPKNFEFGGNLIHFDNHWEYIHF
jgi:hypothetical protein